MIDELHRQLAEALRCLLNRVDNGQLRLGYFAAAKVARNRLAAYDAVLAAESAAVKQTCDRMLADADWEGANKQATEKMTETSHD